VWTAAVGVAALAGLAPPLVTLGVIAAAAFGLLLFKKPVWGAYALVLSIPVQDVVKLPGGINVTQAVFVLVLGVCWMWVALRENRRIVITPIAATLFVFFVTTLPSLWGTTSLPESLAELSRWLVTIFSYIIIINSIQTRREMNGLIVVMLLSGMLESLLGLVQAYGGLGPISFNVGGILTRAYGTIGAPNSFAGYLNMSVPLAMALAAYMWGKWWSARKAEHLLDRPSFVSWTYLRNPVLMTVVALVLFWTMVTTLSRGAWIGLAFGVLVMVLCLGKKASGAIGMVVAGSVLLVGLGAVGALPPVISDRVDLLLSQLTVFDPRGVVPTPGDYAVVERMVHWQVAGNMFLSSPWTGVGIGNFNVLFTKFGVQGWPYSRGHAHNYYLHLLAEVGIIGFLGYMTMLITAFTVGFRALGRARARLDHYGEAVVIGALGVLTTFAVHNFFEDLHALNMGIHWGGALALFTLTWLRARKDESVLSQVARPTSLVLRPTERR
jgi:O-antigen ligase